MKASPKSARITALAGALLLTACSASRAVEEVPASVPAVHAEPAGVKAELSHAQRDQLLRIQSRMAADVGSIRAEMAKLQESLFREALSARFEAGEAPKIRQRLLVLERKRANRILSAIDEAERVIGLKEIQPGGPLPRRALIESLQPWKMM